MWLELEFLVRRQDGVSERLIEKREKEGRGQAGQEIAPEIDT